MSADAAERAKVAEQIALAVWVITAVVVAGGLALALGDYPLAGLVMAVAAGVVGGLAALAIRRAGRSAER